MQKMLGLKPKSQSQGNLRQRIGVMASEAANKEN